MSHPGQQPSFSGSGIRTGRSLPPQEGDNFKSGPVSMEGGGKPIHVECTFSSPPRKGHLQITLIFKSYPGCTEQKVYQATMEDLPLAFSDGTRNGGLKEGAGSLRILEKADARQVEIQAHYIGSTVIIRQVGRYLTFAIRMPEDTLGISEGSADLQLCLHGCPRSELIQEHQLSLASSNPLWPSSQQAYTVESATRQCNHLLQVEDVYFQSCVFDLLTTGDSEFSMAAYGALEDMKALNPRRLKLHTASKTVGSASLRPHLASAVVAGVFALFLLFAAY